MIFLEWQCCAGISISIFLFLFFSTFYAYEANKRKKADDPTKRAYLPHSRWRAPIVVPILVVINTPIFVLVSLAFGVFLVLFPFALLLFRKPFFVKWIEKLAFKVGTALLDMDTKLLTMAGLYRPPLRQASLSA